MRQSAAATILLGSALAWVAPACAEWRVDVGVADEYQSEEAAVIAVAWLSDQRHPWEVTLGHIAERSDAEIPASVFLALSKRFYWRGWFASGGVALVSVDNEQLSGHAQFLSAVGYDFGRVSVSLRHLSNGSTKGNNRGESFLLAEFAF